jgi:hypothetical protein
MTIARGRCEAKRGKSSMFAGHRCGHDSPIFRIKGVGMEMTIALCVIHEDQYRKRFPAASFEFVAAEVQP